MEQKVPNCEKNHVEIGNISHSEKKSISNVRNRSFMTALDSIIIIIN
jgi:hypothetical protein